MPDNSALTAEDVAAILKVSRSMVYKLVKEDRLASYYVGRKLRFTMADVEKYILRTQEDGAPHGTPHGASHASAPLQKQTPTYTLAGNDLIGDIIANYLAGFGMVTSRAYEGSYNALIQAYSNREVPIDAVLSHIYEPSTQTYNTHAIAALLPGMHFCVLRLVKRRQGLIVKAGNPKNLRTWEDLLEKDVRIINREAGCGSRILLDSKLLELKAETKPKGYEQEAKSALAMASFVARGAADVGIGVERIFHQVDGVDFLPLQDEWLDIVLIKKHNNEQFIQTIKSLCKTRAFKEEVAKIVGYNTREMGRVVFEQ